MDTTATIHSKMMKMERSLIQLNDEILTAMTYLAQLKENSAAFVKNLTNISTPSVFLEEFLNVNSFLLKSMSFLTEINCKFELLFIHENSSNNLKCSSSCQSLVAEITDEITQKSEECLENMFSGGVKFSDDNKTTEELLETVVLHAQKQVKRTTPKKTKSKKSQQQCRSNNSDSTSEKINITVIDEYNGDIEYNSNSTHKSVDTSSFKESTDGSSKIKDSEQKSDTAKKSESYVFVPTKDNAQDLLSEQRCDVKISDCQNENLLSSKISLWSSGLSSQSAAEKMESSFVGVPNSLEDSSSINICSGKVPYNTSQLSGNIPVAEVVPTKIKDWWYFSEDLNYTQVLDNDCLKLERLTPEDKPELDDIKPAKIVRKLGEEYDVVVEHIKSPSEFYVSIFDPERNLLMELENRLKLIPAVQNNAYRRKGESTKAMLSMEIGNCALVYSKCEEMWCRAKITNWCLNYSDDYVNVFLLDYGESKCVSIYDLQVMPSYLKQYPPYTVRCHLHDVFPVDMDTKNGSLSWEKETTEWMKSLVENSKKFRIKVAANDSFHPLTSLPVTLWVVGQGNECVNELLVSSRYAVHASVTEKSEKKTEIFDGHLTENDILNNWDPMKEDFESYQNSYDLDINDPSAVIYGYVGRDYERVCKHFANKGYCFKGVACKKEHKRLDPLGFTTDQEEVYQSAINILSVPPPKSVVKVQVTCLLNCNKFFCFLERHNMPSHEEDLKTLLKYMNKKENVLSMKKLLIPPSAGQIVIARYSEDEAWYRARVLESQPENDQYTVLFVDYGNKESLPLSDIRAVEARYLHLPFQAMQCCVYGVDPNPDAPEEEVMDYMRQRIDDGLVSIEVVARLPGENINLLVNVFDREGVNIGEELITKKYGVTKNEMIINSASESMPG